MRQALLTLLPFLFLTCFVYAENISVVMTADKTNLSMEDELELSISVKGIKQGPQPQIQNINDFEVHSRGSSSRVNIINGVMSAEILHHFVLYPQKKGIFSIGPAVITVGRKQYKSDIIQVKVSQGTTTLPSNQNYFISATVDNEKPFVNEQVTYTFQLFSKVRLVDGKLDIPEFNEFWKEDLGEQREYNKTINGVRWSVTEIKTALFPTSKGKITIKPTTLHAKILMRGSRGNHPFFDEFFVNTRRAKPIRLVTKPIDIQVLPLPAQGRPKNFSGLVGQFKLHEELSKTNLAVGESTTLTLAIEGRGNVRDAKISPPNTPKIKVYEDAPIFKMRKGMQWIEGSKTFKWALVPLEEGELELPPIELAYFDTKKKAYETLKAKLPTLQITPGTGETLSLITAPDSQFRKKQIAVLGKDLMPINRGLSALKANSLGQFEKQSLLTILFILPLGYILIWLFKLRFEKIQADTGYERRGKAYKTFRKELRLLKENGQFYEKASLVLRNYLGNKLNMDGGALTPIDIERKLKPFLTDASMKSIAEYLKTCEKGQYGGDAITAERGKSLKTSLKGMIKTLEKEIRA